MKSMVVCALGQLTDLCGQPNRIFAEPSPKGTQQKTLWMDLQVSLQVCLAGVVRIIFRNTGVCPQSTMPNGSTPRSGFTAQSFILVPVRVNNAKQGIPPPIVQDANSKNCSKVAVFAWV